MLSKREVQVARLVAEGKSNKEVAFELGIQPSTLICHMKRIYRVCDIHRGNQRVLLARLVWERLI